MSGTQLEVFVAFDEVALTVGQALVGMTTILQFQLKVAIHANKEGVEPPE